MKQGKIGKVTANGVTLEKHEQDTVDFFTELGYDVEFIPRSNIEGLHRPDIIMEGLEWEIKSPKGEGKWVIKNIVQKAKKQSENIIIDLRRTRLPEEKCLRELKIHFELAKRIKRMKIITKTRKLLEYNKPTS